MPLFRCRAFMTSGIMQEARARSFDLALYLRAFLRLYWHSAISSELGKVAIDFGHFAKYRNGEAPLAAGTAEKED